MISSLPTFYTFTLYEYKYIIYRKVVINMNNIASIFPIIISIVWFFGIVLVYADLILLFIWLRKQLKKNK